MALNVAMTKGRALARGVAVAAIASGLMLSACGGVKVPFAGKSKPAANAQAGIGVNAFLWRATLDTLSFMPLLNADPWGGVVN
jgi:hypothetical protein